MVWPKKDVQTAEGQIRVVSDSLVKSQIPSDHNIPAWLVELGGSLMGR